MKIKTPPKIDRQRYNGSFTIMAKLKKTIELHYPMS